MFQRKQFISSWSVVPSYFLFTLLIRVFLLWRFFFLFWKIYRERKRGRDVERDRGRERHPPWTASFPRCAAGLDNECCIRPKPRPGNPWALRRVTEAQALGSFGAFPCILSGTWVPIWNSWKLSWHTGMELQLLKWQLHPQFQSSSPTYLFFLYDFYHAAYSNSC